MAGTQRQFTRIAAAGAGVSGAVLGIAPAADAADFTVTNLTDGAAPGPAGSLREAIGDANAMPGPDRILFGSSLSGSLLLSGGQLEITEALEVAGPGADVVGIDADNDSRIFFVNPGVAGEAVEISRLSLAYGQTAGSGGAIYNDDAELTVESSFFVENLAGSAGLGGGAIHDAANHADGAATEVISSSFVENQALNGAGGAISSEGQLGRIADSTLFNNYAETDGGAILAETGGVIQNSSFDENDTGDDGGAFATSGTGVEPTIENSVFGRNRALDGSGDELFGTEDFNAEFSSFYWQYSGATINETVMGSNQLGEDPKLGGLSFDSPTPTYPPRFDSPVVDQGSAAAGATLDQRGGPRPFDVTHIANATAIGADASDMGAAELTENETLPIDLILEISDSADPVFVGDPVTYTLEVENQGPEDATGVLAEAFVPEELTFSTSGTSAGCTQDPEPGGTLVTCLVPSVVSGNTATRTISTSALAGAALYPYVSVYAGVFADQVETRNSDNYAYEDTSVRRRPTQSTPPAPVTTNPFNLGAAIKRCKTKFRGKQRAKCIKKARQRASAGAAGRPGARRADAIREQVRAVGSANRGLYRRFLGS